MPQYRASRERGPCRKCREMIDVGQMFEIDAEEDEMFAHVKCPKDDPYCGMTVDEQRRSRMRDCHRPPAHHAATKISGEKKEVKPT